MRLTRLAHSQLLQLSEARDSVKHLIGLERREAHHAAGREKRVGGEEEGEEGSFTSGFMST